jgi:hypothetical protein
MALYGESPSGLESVKQQEADLAFAEIGRGSKMWDINHLLWFGSKLSPKRSCANNG